MNDLKEELQKIGILFIIAYVFFQVHYYKESVITVLRLLIGHFYLFIIPGYCIMLYYMKRIDFAYRLFIGIGLGYSIQSLSSFFIAMAFKLNIRTYYLLIPLLFIAAGMYGYRKGGNR